MLKDYVIRNSLKGHLISLQIWTNLYWEKIEPYGIGSGQFPFLMRLYREDGINQESLSDYLKIDKGTTARAIQKLVDEGYVFRQRDEKDRRSYRVFLTEKGKKLEPDMKK